MTILVPIVPMATIQRKKPVPVLVLHSLLRMGERVKIARKARQMTQAELAQLAGVGISTVASIEGATMASHLVMLRIPVINSTQSSNASIQTSEHDH